LYVSRVYRAIRPHCEQMQQTEKKPEISLNLNVLEASAL